MRKIGIACINNVNALGYKNSLLYSIPNELNIFQKITTKTLCEQRPNIVVMGKNTFQSINNKPLKNRFNCVLSSNAAKLNEEYKSDSLRFFRSINDVMEYSTKNEFKFNNMFICGGSSLYSYFINNNLLDYLVISQITNHEYGKGDAFFPDFKDTFIQSSSFKHYNNPSIIIDSKDKLNLDFTCKTYYNPNKISLPDNYLQDIQNLTKSVDLKCIQNKNEPNKPLIDGEWAYMNALSDILYRGEIRQTRNSKTISKFGTHMEFDVSNFFPLLTTKKVYWNGVIKELLWFLKANTNSKDLSDQKVKIWDGNSSREYLDSIGLNHYKEGECGPIYGFQWRHFNAQYKGFQHNYKGEGVDQLQEIINLIKTDPSSRRMIMSAWNPCQLSEMCLPPCHVLYQFYVRTDMDGVKHLSCQMYQRSGDMFLGIPFNIASTTALTYILAHMTDCKPDRVIINIGDAHIYGSHINAVKKQLERAPYEFPKLNILGKGKNNIEDYDISDFVIENYRHHSNISAPMIA